MPIIKIDANSMDQICNNLDSFAGNTYMAQKYISEVIPVLDEMQFRTKEEIIEQLENYQKRLSTQYSLGKQYKKAVNSTYDALCDVDDSLSDSVENVWTKVDDWKSYSSNTLAPFASCALVQNQSAVTNTLIAGGTALGFVSIAKTIFETIKNWFLGMFGKNESMNGSNESTSSNNEVDISPAIDHTIPFVSAWTGDLDASIWPDGYLQDYSQNWGGCAVASTSSALSGLLGRLITPKEIMSFQDGSVSMQWGNGAKTWGVNCETKTYPTVTDLDIALKNYLNNPDKYSAPILGTAKPNTHYVVVTGYDSKSGAYSIIDSSGNNAMTYTIGEYHLSRNGFSGPPGQLVQYIVS